jgi:hypothetical protein
MTDQEFASHTGLQIEPLNGEDIIEARKIWEDCVDRHNKSVINTIITNSKRYGKEYLESVKKAYE